ncbi:class I SAM-dependent methyltransferase [uncultured Parvibaculum sp.]|uniref:class I SAM-dependent methyltransferase n=1 Tax=uncultured Parvibaculum sp. TaxID=291828 RepID=UPI0030D7214B
MFYRAERFKPEQLFRDAIPAVFIDDERATLKDLSMTGIAVQSAKADGWDNLIGAEMPFELRLGEARLFGGAGRVRRIEPHGMRTTVALEFTTGYLDIPTIVTDHDSLVLTQALADPAFGSSQGILPEFQQLSTEILNLFRSYKDILETFEARLTATGRERERLLLDALIACEDRIVPQWKELWYRGNDILAPVWSDPAMLARHKRYAERVLTPDFMPGAVMKRCYEKPLGYPGDFRIMNYVYEWQRVGDTPYEKLLHRIGIETGACVGTRLRMTQKLIAERIAASAGDTPLNIANLGCGSAYEVYDYLKIDHLPSPVNFTLIDQDDRALNHAYEHAYPEVVRHAGRAKVQCLQASFAQLLKAGALFKSLPPQDVIYSLGLYDYLSARRARALTHDLYAQVKPGGQLILANVKKGREACEWPLEFVTDWSLVYRTESDMLALIDGLDIANVTVEVDSTKCIYLMVVDKPA